MPRMHRALATALGVALIVYTTGTLAQGQYGVGRTATPAEIAGWNIDIGRDGSGLPPGSGTVSRGREVFAQQCAACHGENGEGGIGDKLVGGQGTLSTSKPVRTVGGYWPYAPTLFDYIRRAMPQNAPESLSNDDVYAVSAYILNLNGLVPNDTTLDAKSLPSIKMPNRKMFVADPRPDVKTPACIKDCSVSGH
jgi:mono/diheme cytochrome c family protein